ncbi:hypothetical protein Q7P35_002273 [Cladosporium inversicolor]
MQYKTLICTLLVMAVVFVAAQDDFEPTCPGPCPFGEFDEDTLISDCTAQCNTTFGDPDAAEECVNACSNWQDSISCTATPQISRRSLTATKRRRRVARKIGAAATHPQTGHEGRQGYTDDKVEYRSDLTLERRDINSCIRSCYSSVHVISICPGNAIAFMSQAAV